MKGARSIQTVRLCALLSAMAAAVTASSADAVPADAQVAVVTPLSFIQVENLDFGRVIPSNVAGTVTISTTNVRTSTNGIVLVGNDYQVGRFAGMGSQNQRVRIRITPTTIILTGPGPSMIVNNVLIGPAPTLQQIGGSSNYRIVPSNGIFWFTVGGTLNVGANQPAGAYSGTFTATLDYQ